MSKEQQAHGVLAWAFRDSTTGKASSTKIVHVLIALGAVIVFVIWAVQGVLAPEHVLWLLGIETANNVGVRRVKAHAAKAPRDDGV